MSGSKIGLRLLNFRKFTPNITGRDKFSKIKACPSKRKFILDIFILTSTCPTVLIVEFAKTPLALGKFDGFIDLAFPPSFGKKTPPKWRFLRAKALRYQQGVYYKQKNLYLHYW